MPLTSSVLIQLSALLTNTGFDLTLPSAPLSWAKQFNLGNGVGLNEADLIFSDRRELAASATEDLDVSGSLTNPFGAALDFVRIKGLFVTAALTNTNNVVVSRPVNGVPIFSAAADAIPVMPGGFFGWLSPNADGAPVTAGTGDLITFANSAAGTPVTYEVVIIGASA